MTTNPAVGTQIMGLLRIVGMPHCSPYREEYYSSYIFILKFSRVVVVLVAFGTKNLLLFIERERVRDQLLFIKKRNQGFQGTPQ